MTPDGDRVDLDELAALEEQRVFLLTSLDDLDREHEAGDLDDADYETLRADYTARAARVIEAIENRQELIDATDPGHRVLRRVLLGAAVLLVAIVAGVVVTATSGTQRETADAPGTLTPSAETEACIETMQRAFAPATDDASDSGSGSDAVATLECFTDRIEDDPTDAVAYTYRGRTLALLARQLTGVAPAEDVANFTARSRADLAEALKLEPEYPDALAFAAMDALADDDLVAARSYLDRIDRLQLPADSPVLPIINNAIRPAIQAGSGPDAREPSTSVPSGSTPPAATVP